MSEPLVRVLRLVDGDDRPSMGYLYDVIHHAKEEMMRRFQKRKARVKPFITLSVIGGMDNFIEIFMQRHFG